jgi:hypothetical protein
MGVRELPRHHRAEVSMIRRHSHWRRDSQRTCADEHHGGRESC